MARDSTASAPAAKSPWQGLLLFFGVYFGAMLFAALLSPWVYGGMVAWAEAAPNPLNSYLEGKGFEDYFDRLRWIPVVVLLPWLFKFAGLWSWQALGIGLGSQARTRFLRWAGLGAVLALAVIAGQCLLGTRHLSPDFGPATVLGGLFAGIAGGLALGLLEEIVFRGLTQRIFSRAAGAQIGLLATALFFAYAHFKMPDVVWQETGGEVRWWSGFFVAGWTVVGIIREFDAISFASLFFLGLALGLLVREGRLDLMRPIGLHAGIVAPMLCAHAWLEPAPRSEWAHPEWAHLIAGGASLRDGLLALTALAVLAGIIFWRRLKAPAP